MTNLFYYFLLVIDKNKLLIFSILISFLVFTFLLDRLKLSCAERENKIIHRLRVFISVTLIFIFLIIIIYKFYSGLNFDIGLLGLIISFLISFTISNFVLNKFKFSKNIYIRFIQRFVIYNIIFITVIAFIIYLSSLFNLIPTIYCSNGEDNISNKGKDVIKVNSETDDTNKEYYNFKISKNLFDNGLHTVGEASKMAVDKVVPNIGAGAAAGTAAAAAVKATSGLPPLQRAGAVAATALVTAASTKVGLDIGNAISKNTDFSGVIKNSPHANPDIMATPPSPDSLIINSTLESSDITSPLQDLLIYSFTLDIFILLLLISLLIIIFNRYILSFNLNFINSILNKYISIKIRNWFNKYLNTGIDYNNKLVLFMFIINSIGLFLIVLLKIFLSSELLINIDSYIEVHNYIHYK